MSADSTPLQSSAVINEAVQALRDGGLVAFPTETVYGLGADAKNPGAIQKIFTAKGRPSNHPLIVHLAAPDVFDQAQIDWVTLLAPWVRDLSEEALKLVNTFWPGPLTLVFKKDKSVLNELTGGQDTVAIRAPAHPMAQELLRKFKGGIVAPSANRFGKVSPTSAADVRAEFEGMLDFMVLDGGDCEVGIESTIIDCTRGVPVLLRPGAVTREQVQAACGVAVLSNEAMEALDKTAPRASGTLESHYAPNAKVRLMDAKALQTALDLLGRDADGKGGAPVIATYSRAVLKTPSATVLRQRMPDDAAATAQQLFAVLRAFDAQGVKLIWIETPPDTPEWDGVRDRLQRSAAG